MRGWGGNAVGGAVKAGTFTLSSIRAAPRAHLISKSITEPTPHYRFPTICPQFWLTHKASKQTCHEILEKRNPYTVGSTTLFNTTTPISQGRARLHSILRIQSLQPRSAARMASTTADAPEWSAPKVRETFIKFFEEKGHTFGTLLPLPYFRLLADPTS